MTRTNEQMKRYCEVILQDILAPQLGKDELDEVATLLEALWKDGYNTLPLSNAIRRLQGRKELPV